MAHKSSIPGHRDLSPAHPNEGDDERWKTSPSTETTGDRGENARTGPRHQREENTPASPHGPKIPRSTRSRRG
jgi:hypothetical protein